MEIMVYGLLMSSCDISGVGLEMTTNTELLEGDEDAALQFVCNDNEKCLDL